MKKLMLFGLALVLAGVYIVLAVLFVSLLAFGTGFLFLSMGAGEVSIATAYIVSIIAGVVFAIRFLEYICKRFVAKRGEPKISGG